MHVAAITLRRGTLKTEITWSSSKTEAQYSPSCTSSSWRDAVGDDAPRPCYSPPPRTARSALVPAAFRRDSAWLTKEINSREGQNGRRAWQGWLMLTEDRPDPFLTFFLQSFPVPWYSGTAVCVAFNERVTHGQRA
eukprot:2850667-Rhodomonas_salina.2